MIFGPFLVFVVLIGLLVAGPPSARVAVAVGLVLGLVGMFWGLSLPTHG